MSIGDIVILLGVAVWAVIAVKRGWKNRKRGCSGDLYPRRAGYADV